MTRVVVLALLIAGAGRLTAQSAAMLLASAEAYFRANRLDSAATLFRRVVDPASGATTEEQLNAWVRLGVIRFASGDSAGAAAAFGSAFAIDSGLQVGGLDQIDPVLNAIFDAERNRYRVFAITAVDPPRLESAPPIQYPPALKARGVQGRVIVEAIIDTAGRPEPASVRVMETPDTALIAPAMALLLDSRFQPGRLHGRPVRVVIHVPLDFTLTPVDAADTARERDPVDTVYSCAPRCRGVDKPPRYIQGPPRREVVTLRPYDRGGDFGVVVLRAVVDTFGLVEPGSAMIFSSTAPVWVAELDLKDLREARFEPGEARGRKVRVLIERRVTIRFRSPARR